MDENYQSIVSNISIDKFLEIFSNYENIQLEIENILRQG